MPLFRYKDSSNIGGPGDPKVTVIDLNNGEQALIQLFDDGQVHLAFREGMWDTWDTGYWSIITDGWPR